MYHYQRRFGVLQSVPAYQYHSLGLLIRTLFVKQIVIWITEKSAEELMFSMHRAVIWRLPVAKNLDDAEDAEDATLPARAIIAAYEVPTGSEGQR